MTSNLNATFENRERVEKMRNALFYVGVYRERAQALDGLGRTLRCETPGTVETVHVKGNRWWRKSSPDAEPREITLSDDERREFRDWCEERAKNLHQRADELEIEVATGGTE